MDARIAKAYERGDDYVSQTTAALKDFRHRQEKLDQETTMAQLLARFEREALEKAQTDHREDAGPDKQGGAPGGGRTRSR